MIEQSLIIRRQTRNSSFAKYPLRKKARTGGFGSPASDTGFVSGSRGRLNARIDEKEVGPKGAGILLHMDKTGTLQITARFAHRLGRYAEFFCQEIDAGIAAPGPAVHHVSQHDKQPKGRSRQSRAVDQFKQHS